MHTQKLAKEQLIELLRAGKVEEFNQYRIDTGYGLIDLIGADLSGAILSTAILNGANLNGAYLRGANLNGAYLRGAYLRGAYLNGANLTRAHFDQAFTGMTTFADVDLSEVKGLESVRHRGPSTIGLDTIYKSRGQIPEVFLRGCGVSDWQIETAKLSRPDLSNKEINDIGYRIYDLRARQVIQINPLFISYNHTDGSFVDRMEALLNDSGIRFWRDIHDAVGGPLEEQIDDAIAQDRTVLVILSKHSVESDWVEHEVRRAREVPKETGRHVLYPIALDDSWKTCSWPKSLMEQVKKYNNLDFSDWKTPDTLQRMYGKLINGLDLFYKKSETPA